MQFYEIGIWSIITTFISLLLSLFHFPDELKLLYIQNSIVKTHINPFSGPINEFLYEMQHYAEID